MSLNRGVHLGPYEILQLIGEGGMGQVYKARDTRLNRTVAIKVLPPEFATRSDWKQRFEREAQIIASLNHPHICTLHDVGQQDGMHYLIMEYLDGQTLAHRLQRGALALDEALKIAVEITNALEKAHRQGIVHRDLKPANVMLTKDGVKLLDFGLAKPVAPPAGLHDSSMPTAGPATNLTAEGTILGTLQYMSPEQLEGIDADTRSDIFAFGAVLYEMLAGRKAFEARSQSSIIAAIIHVDPPDIATLQPATPALLDRVVKTCLAKDPDKRWQTAHDLSLQLRWISEPGLSAEMPAAALSPRRRSHRALWILTIFLAMVAAILAVPATRYFQRQADSLTPRFEVQTTAMLNQYQISISPDGTTLAYVAVRGDGMTALFVRPIDSVTAQPLPETDGALLPFWSPDSHYIGYADPQRRKLKKISVRGGPPQVVCEVPYSGNAVPIGTWNSNGIIVFANGDANQPLYRVSAAGGSPVQITTLDKTLQETGHSWPWFLPDGRHFLYMARSSNPENSAIYAGSLDSPSRTKLISAASMPIFAPPGFLLFHREGALFAQQFDDRSLSLSGERILIAEDLISNPVNGRAAFAVSSNGTLIYRSGRMELPLTWVDRNGKSQSVAAEPGHYVNPTLSPDGKRLAVTKIGGSDGEVWIMDLVRGASTQFTSNPSMNTMPLWSPDGRRLMFASDRGGIPASLFIKDSDGTGNEELLLKSDHTKSPEDWSFDSRYLLYGDRTPGRNYDLWVLPMDGEHKPFVFSQTHSSEAVARFSPDARWVLYQSNDGGREEVYVRSFPTAGDKFQISKGGGVMPKWRSDGKEIFYINGNALMAVDVMRAELNKTFAVGAPRLLFQATFSAAPYPYDVSSDGQRFIINGIPNSTSLPSIPITVVLNWPALTNKK